MKHKKVHFNNLSSRYCHPSSCDKLAETVVPTWPLRYIKREGDQIYHGDGHTDSSTKLNQKKKNTIKIIKVTGGFYNSHQMR